MGREITETKVFGSWIVLCSVVGSCIYFRAVAALMACASWWAVCWGRPVMRPLSPSMVVIWTVQVVA